MNKMSGIVSFRKNILGWLGDRTIAPSLLVRSPNQPKIFFVFIIKQILDNVNNSMKH